MTEPQTARRWTVRLYNPYEGLDGHMRPDQERAQALALLRSQIRLDGAVVDSKSITREGGEEIAVTDQGETVDVTLFGATGQIATWSAEGYGRGIDAADLLPDNVDDGGAQWYLVPDGIARDGGEVRLRHNLDGHVTVLAFGDVTAKAPVGYLIAAEVDLNVVSVALLPGTALLTLTRDPDVMCVKCGTKIDLDLAGQMVHVTPDLAVAAVGADHTPVVPQPETSQP